MKSKAWILKEQPSPEAIAKLSSEINVSRIPATLLLQRHIADFETARSFFRPQLTDLLNPFLMKDMQKAIERIQKAVREQEKVLIYGDYDVDGTTSVSLAYLFFKNYLQNLHFYIPNRQNEGYGVSTQGADYIISQKFNLVISLDCGIRSTEAIGRIMQEKIDFIVCDHHLPDENDLPLAFAILNPKQYDCPFPYKELSGCGIAFKVLQAYCIAEQIPQENLLEFIDLVAVGIAADIVPITGENRILAHLGLHKLNQNPLMGFAALIKNTDIRFPIEIKDIVFGIAPLINAPGRIADASDALKLLLAHQEEEANLFVKVLQSRNEERRQMESLITLQAKAQAENLFYDKSSLVLFEPNWHKGVLGIVAARCVDAFYRPTIVLTLEGDLAVGSARSIWGINIFDALQACNEYLEQFGGHAFAAGLSLKPHHLVAFRESFEQAIQKQAIQRYESEPIWIDLEISLNEISPKMYSILKQMSPFGPENMRPVLMSKSVFVENNIEVIKDKHLKCTFYQNGMRLNAIGFGMANYADMLMQRRNVDICYVITENTYKNKTSLVLELKDIR